jgi:hypothetical protein
VGLAWRLHRVRGGYDSSPQNRRGCLVEPQNQDRRLGGGDGIWARQEALKRVTCGMIEVLALGGHEGPMDARPSDGELHVLTKMPL